MLRIMKLFSEGLEHNFYYYIIYGNKNLLQFPSLAVKSRHPPKAALSPSINLLYPYANNL
jgi:hypothetical protein